MATVICRSGYCQCCYDNHRPKKGNLFLVHGTHRGGYYVREARFDGLRGYVPHLFILKEVTNDMHCIVLMACAMNHCSVENTKKNGHEWYSVKDNAWQTITMPVKEWNALYHYVRDQDYYV